jgi:hypothetical protein
MTGRFSPSRAVALRIPGVLVGCPDTFACSTSSVCGGGLPLLIVERDIPAYVPSAIFAYARALGRHTSGGNGCYVAISAYDQIREVMSLQGSLSIERMCELVRVSRASFYRSLREQRPVPNPY